MKCPFELPIEKKVTHVTEAGVKYKVIAGTLVIAAFLSKSEADYIVQAVNNHDRLEEFAKRIAKGSFCGQKNCPAYALTLANNALENKSLGECTGHQQALEEAEKE